MLNVAQQFAKTLQEIGVKYVFGVPSGNMIDYIEAIRQEEGIEFITVGHEATAAIMADVCGRITGVPGVCFGTFGPGATNLSSGVGGAFLDRSPMLAFTDEMPDKLLHRTVQMRIDHQALFAPITKWTTRMQASTVKNTILQASNIAKANINGPVHIGVPSGIASLTKAQVETEIWEENQPITPDFNIELEKFKKAFKYSRKPIIAIGLSAVRCGASVQIKKLAEKFSIPIVLTPMSKGMLNEDHPLYIGVLFHALSNIVAETYGQADLVIGIGYDPVEINYEDWMPRVPLVHIDIKPVDVDLDAVILEAELIGQLKTVLELFTNFEKPANNWDLNEVQKRKTKMFQALSPSNQWGPRAVISELRKSLPVEGILSVDVGAHLHLLGQQWRTPLPEKLIMTNGWSSMGFAIPAAMAAKILNPDLPVACLLGDGGFFMTAGELATIKRLSLTIVIVIIIDCSLSLIEIKQQKKGFDSSYGTSLNPANYFTSDSYFGIPVLKVTDLASCQRAMLKAFQMKEAVVIEAHVDGDEYKNLVLKPTKLS